MQNCKFSETQYSFCFTFEYIKKFFPMVPLPIFPNTVEEGRAGCGYDVSINGNIYFQFKIPRYYDKVSNFWRRDWDVFGHEYYKIKINTDEEQFRLLKTLKNTFNDVYYSTPSFHTREDLSTHYGLDNIVDNSTIFSIDSLPAFGSGRHDMIYSPSHNWGRLFSEPIKINFVKNIHPHELFPKEQKESSIYKEALRIASILKEGQFKTSTDLAYNKPINLVKHIYSTLLIDFNIHWYPIISKNNF